MVVYFLYKMKRYNYCNYSYTLFDQNSRDFIQKYLERKGVKWIMYVCENTSTRREWKLTSKEFRKEIGGFP